MGQFEQNSGEAQPEAVRRTPSVDEIHFLGAAAGVEEQSEPLEQAPAYPAIPGEWTREIDTSRGWF